MVYESLIISMGNNTIQRNLTPKIYTSITNQMKLLSYCLTNSGWKSSLNETQANMSSFGIDRQVNEHLVKLSILIKIK